MRRVWVCAEDCKPLRYFRKLEVRAGPHGLRSSFRDWATEETGHPSEVIEVALAQCGQEENMSRHTRRRGSLGEARSPYRAAQAGSLENGVNRNPPAPPPVMVLPVVDHARRNQCG